MFGEEAVNPAGQCLSRNLPSRWHGDGGQHGDAVAYDASRTAWLETQGFRVLRFWNNDILLRTEDVLDSILRALESAR